MTAEDTVPAHNLTLRPVLTVRSYSITYNLDGGAVSVANPTSYNVNSGDITLNNPTKEGYEFAGWTGSNGFVPSMSVTIQSGKTGNLSFTANWVKNYSITYNLNGGTVAVANPTSYNINSGDITLNNPTKEGYEFSGWTGSNGTTASTSVKIPKGSTGNKNYTGNWKANTYTVKFNANGGSGSMSNESFTYDTEKALTANAFTAPTATGYTYSFLGWSTNSAATSATYTDKQSVKNLTSTNNGTVNLYAIWSKTANTYKITYNGNGATGGSTAETSFTYGNTASVRSNGFTRTNYSFTGWNTKADGSGTPYAAGASYTSAANLTLYAQWKRESFTLEWAGGLLKYGKYLGSGSIIGSASNSGWKRIVYTDTSGKTAYADPYKAGSITIKADTAVNFQIVAGSNTSSQGYGSSYVSCSVAVNEAYSETVDFQEGRNYTLLSASWTPSESYSLTFYDECYSNGGIQNWDVTTKL